MRYNERFNPEVAIQTPSFQAVIRMEIDDSFWETSDLIHPNEDWAVDPQTISGIESWRTERNSVEEMRRIGQEVRQQLKWAVEYSTKVKELEHSGK